MKLFDIAITGSGLAGSSAIIELANKEITNVIIEKEILPRYKTFGGGFAYIEKRKVPFDFSEVLEKEFFRVDTFFKNANAHFFSEIKESVISMLMRYVIFYKI